MYLLIIKLIVNLIKLFVDFVKYVILVKRIENLSFKFDGCLKKIVF